MGRKATVASGNVWYQARIAAAKYNEQLNSRFGAAEAAGMSEDAIKDTELGLEKRMPVEKAVILADLYNAPNLLNHYCLYECPIGRNRPLSDEIVPIERITLKLIKSTRVGELGKIIDRLVEISEDGWIDEYEIEDLEEIVKYLETVSKTVDELGTITKKVIGNKK